MMQELTTSPVSEEKVQGFFDFIDNFAQTRGANVPQIVEIEKLRSLREGSFGRAWADFLDENNLQPLTTGIRRKQLHDGIHVLTGYGSDSIGEAEVQAFLLGAKFGLFNLLIGVGLLRVIRKRLHHQTNVAKQRMWQAYQRGKKSKLNPDEWQPELLWNLPLAEVKAMFCLQ
ncbi:MAG: Coq4 family protein [Rivularia sp. (in: cyanobacteria)]